MTISRLHADAFMSQGDTHSICQDYALAEKVARDLMGSEPDVPIAIVSDGCSSSPMTDFGARFLARAALQHLATVQATGISLSGETIIEKALQMSNAVGVPHRCLDATLMVAYPEGEYVRVCVWGDGVVAWKLRDGTQHFVEIGFDHNAPAYLSYKLDPLRMETYLDKTGQAARRVTQHSYDPIDGGQIGEYRERGFCPEEFGFPLRDLELLVLCSDGIQTFQRPVEEVVGELLDVKTSTGEFVQRRCRRILKQHRAKGGRVGDDFSVAAIWCGDYAPPEAGG